jgi:hypothetical protein
MELVVPSVLILKKLYLAFTVQTIPGIGKGDKGE